MDVADGEDVVSMGMDANVYSLRTEIGEEMLVEGSISATADNEEFSAAFEGTLVTELAGDLPVAMMTEALQIPELGIAEWREAYTLTAIPQVTPQDLTVIVLETASPESIEALADRAMGNIEQTLTLLLEMLPPELTETAE